MEELFDNFYIVESSSDEETEITQKQPEWQLPDYEAKIDYENWFDINPDTLTQVLATKEGPTQAKQRIEYLYFTKNYALCYEMCALFLHNLDVAKVSQPREIIEIGVKSAYKLGKPTAELKWMFDMLNSNEPGHHILKGEYYLKCGELEEGLSYIKKYWNLRPSDPQCLKLVANYFRDRSESDDSWRCAAHHLYARARQAIVASNWKFDIDYIRRRYDAEVATLDSSIEETITTLPICSSLQEVVNDVSLVDWLENQVLGLNQPTKVDDVEEDRAASTL